MESLSKTLHERKFYMKRILMLLLALSPLGPVPAFAGGSTVLVAAASSMKFPFTEIAKAFERENPGTSVKLSFGSSGNFYSQILNRAPFDVYFSADVTYPARLAEKGMSLDSSPPQLYARGRLVLWIPSMVGIDPVKDKMVSLLNPSIKKVAIANPSLAPYGRAAVEAMNRAGIYIELEPRLVFGENISQAAQFAHSGAAQAGLIAYSLAVTDKMKTAGSFWEIPPDFYAPIDQSFLLLTNTQNPEGARSFARFVTHPKGQKILERYGFGFPESRPR
ncbi:MAG: molybdate ABC transporter substrate-binding protein [Nitrospinae bacterium CG11_big_fil_rev_8_21_14_0_20_56_8]|nr:MAG: molybdate ABC transporter substrate-binding protein [Nitrospinae bacterium CG11_big_fil_rev_8_21_14_0_20_56_8]